jgi:hypothetical protein
MAVITISEILDDIRVADETLLKFERRYWITSEQFFELYNKGLLDNGEHVEDFSEWAGFYKLKQRREVSFHNLGEKRLKELKSLMRGSTIQLKPQEPTVEAL